jgi:hypothetical protein
VAEARAREEEKEEAKEEKEEDEVITKVWARVPAA